LNSCNNQTIDLKFIAFCSASFIIIDILADAATMDPDKENTETTTTGQKGCGKHGPSYTEKEDCIICE
jgi:hypothetical protein